MACSLTGWSVFGKNMIGKWITKKVGKGVCGQASLNGEKKVKIFVFHENAH